ncbi:hypothetical protein Nepgr_021853 [Nepenthes gracilis]|uniref:Uncharacterized protein n=1 Tax=Nepenthes gracilis TaxID=150966 RepID=A0AAD3T0S6_NEPGR|nr:hypothetical protein Nepgr_021853 [Nepenthes gracilis]
MPYGVRIHLAREGAVEVVCRNCHNLLIKHTQAQAAKPFYVADPVLPLVVAMPMIGLLIIDIGKLRIQLLKTSRFHVAHNNAARSSHRQYRVGRSEEQSSLAFDHASLMTRVWSWPELLWFGATYSGKITAGATRI